MTEHHHDPTRSSEGLIQEIALTNQISVPWGELRTVLKQRLEQVLESKQLAYTEPTVTNPLTTKLTPLSTSSSPFVAVTQTETAETAPSANSQNSQTSPIVSSSLSPQEQQGVQGSEDLDQAHVPEQGDKDKDQSQSPEEKLEETKLKEGPVLSNVETGADDAAGMNQAEGSTALSTTSSETTVTSATTSAASSANGSIMVPISKDTLLVETPEGYHSRINGLLDAFTSAPFTIQRVCELLSSPTEHHSNLIKYLRAVEKVLMITSSVNEFSNPAYNGPSALDEDSEKIASKEAGSGAAAANGDYSRGSDLDFSLLTETPAPLSSDATEEEEEESAEAKDNYATEQTEDSGASSLNTPSDNAKEETHEETAEDHGMDVEDKTATPTVGASDMDVDPTSASTMDGVVTHAEDESGDIQVDIEAEGGMELDQA